MDVKLRLSVLVAALALASCAKVKTTSSVLDGNTSQGSNGCAGEAILNKFIVEWEDGHISVEKAKDIEEFKNDFLSKNLTFVRKAQYDRKIKLQLPTVYQGESTQKIQSLTLGTTSTIDEWGQYQINANKLWAKGIIGTGVKVGIVDTNVDITHPQLAPRVKSLTSFISSGVLPDNPSVHGSHVSGIIAADPSAGPMHGIAYGADIYAAPFLGDDGTGDLGDAIKALNHLATQGVRVINASWGGSSCSSTLQNTFNSLSAQGILLVVAAGNGDQYGRPIDLDISPFYPAAFKLSNEITVAATTSIDMLTSWSNNGFKSVHVGAPGSNIVSTVPYKADSSGYRSLQGTSMAAPIVTGAAALLFGAHPNATATQVRQALMQSVDVNPNFYIKVETRGRINVENALTELSKIVQ